MRTARNLTIVAGLAALIVFGGLTHRPTPAQLTAATVTHCGTWTRSGTIRNDTGQEVYLHDTDGRIPRRLVVPGGSVPFSETLPASAWRHADTMVVESLDYTGGQHPASGWSFTEDEWLYRPADCTP